MSAQAVEKRAPELRFPEFSGEWEETRLEKIGFLKSGTGFPEAEQGGKSGIPFFKVSDMNLASNQETLNIANNYVNSEQIHRLKFSPIEAQSIVFAKVGAAIFLERKRAARNFLFDNNMMAFTPNSANHFSFLQLILHRTRLSRYAQVGALPSYNASDVGSIRVFLSKSIPEQQKIASFLEAVSQKTALLTEKRDSVTAYKRGVMQRLFSGALRFRRDDGSAFPDWEEKRLNQVLFEHKSKNEDDLVVFSVSVHLGLIDQISHLGRSFAAQDTSHYNRVNCGDIVYTKSPTGDFPLGIIKQSSIEHPVAVSPLYGVFRPQTVALGQILHAHFESPIATKNYLHSLVQKGAKNTIAVTNTRFLEGKLVLPVDPDEQQKIADALSALDAKIDALNSKISEMETFKKGLLQKMFV